MKPIRFLTLLGLALCLTQAVHAQYWTATAWTQPVLPASESSLTANYPPVLVKGMWSSTNTPVSGVIDTRNSEAPVLAFTGLANNSAGALTIGVVLNFGIFATNFPPANTYYATFALPQSNAVNTGYFSVATNLSAIVNGARYVRIQYITNSHATVPIYNLGVHYGIRLP